MSSVTPIRKIRTGPPGKRVRPTCGRGDSLLCGLARCLNDLNRESFDWIRDGGLPARPKRTLFQQVIELDRFRYEIVHAGRQTAITVICEGAGGQGYDRHFLRPALQSPDLSGSFEAIKLRHMQVHQNEIELPGLNRFHSLIPVIDCEDVAPSFLEHDANNLLINRIILSYQNSYPVQGMDHTETDFSLKE